MNNIPFDTMRDVDNLRREINQVYGLPFSFFEENVNSQIRFPFIDIYETDEEFIISCDLPGLQSKEDVMVTVQDNVVTISGTIYPEQSVQEKLLYKDEHFNSPFCRNVPLPLNVSSEHVKASYKNGVLNVVFSKFLEGNKRSVDIEFQH